MYPTHFKITCAILITLMLALSGCLGGPSPTPATRFYVLNSLHSSESNANVTPVGVLGEDSAIGVGPIKLSQVLDRPQIILRTSHNEIRVADLDRWAAPLNEMITNVLVDNFTTLLSTGRILKFPWKTAITIDYQVIIEITRFDGLPEGNVDLRARWGILGDNGRQVLTSGKSVLTEPVGGDTITEMVTAQSRLVAKLSLDIAKEIKRLEKNKSGQ